jgi:predicted DNA-binding protein with PD1-like motif
MKTWPRMAATIALLSLDPGEDVLDAITQACRDHGIRDGVVLSGIGTLDRCRLHCVTTTGYPPEETYPEWHDEPIELVALAGTVIGGIPHVHATISNVSGAWGGHLEPGCRVLYLAEIAIARLSGPELQRSADDHGVVRLR